MWMPLTNCIPTARLGTPDILTRKGNNTALAAVEVQRAVVISNQQIDAVSASLAKIQIAGDSKPQPDNSEQKGGSQQPKAADKSDLDVYDDVEIEDMDYDESLETYFFPCPCGDKFRITKVGVGCECLQEAIIDGEEIATCPSCSLRIRVIYNADDFKREESEAEDDED